MILAGLAAVGGFMNLPGLHTFGNWLEHTIHLEEAAHAAEGAAEAAASGGFNLTVAIVSTLLALLALAISWFIYDRRYKANLKMPPASRPDDPLRGMLGPVFGVLENKYYVDELYWALILNPYINLSRFLAETVDWRFWHDWFHDSVLVGGFRLIARLLAVRIDLGGIDAIANGLADLTRWVSSQLRRIQTGYVRNYAMSVFLGVIIILGYLILRL
jgi:NADH-quinone oxidoreductase subunit L